MKMNVVYVDPKSLIPYENNARKHSQKQLHKLKASIKSFGFIVPVLIDEKRTILAGHARVMSAIELGLTEVPVILAQHLTELQKKAFIIADNRISQDATWDLAKLKDEFSFLSVGAFEAGLTGFDTTEIDALFSDSFTLSSTEVSTSEARHYLPTSKLGDVWELGNHLLVCGDSLKADNYSKLLDGEKVEMVFTDPPYNVPIAGHVKARSKDAREFTMASGEMTSEEFSKFLHQFFSSMQPHLRDGAIAYVCMDWRHISEMLTATKSLYEFKQLCVWSKDRAGMGSFYRSQHELVFVFKNGKAPHVNNFGLGEHGRYRTNVWNYPMVYANDQHQIEGHAHPTVKPLSLIMDAIYDCSSRKGIILDPFGGSGSTLIAAEKTGRRARLIEIDPVYCDMIVGRWEKATNKKAYLQSTGQTIEQLKNSRFEGAEVRANEL